MSNHNRKTVIHPVHMTRWLMRPDGDHHPLMVMVVWSLSRSYIATVLELRSKTSDIGTKLCFEACEWLATNFEGDITGGP